MQGFKKECFLFFLLGLSHRKLIIIDVGCTSEITLNLFVCLFVCSFCRTVIHKKCVWHPTACPSTKAAVKALTIFWPTFDAKVRSFPTLRTLICYNPCLFKLPKQCLQGRTHTPVRADLCRKRANEGTREWSSSYNVISQSGWSTLCACVRVCVMRPDGHKTMPGEKICYKNLGKEPSSTQTHEELCSAGTSICILGKQ